MKIRWRTVMVIVGLLFLFGCAHEHPYPDHTAIVNVKRIQQAEELFRSRHRRYGSLSELAASSPELVDSELATGRKGGHRFSLSAMDRRFVIQTEPVVWGRTGFRSFYSDQTLVIRQSFGPGLATAEADILN